VVRLLEVGLAIDDLARESSARPEFPRSLHADWIDFPAVRLSSPPVGPEVYPKRLRKTLQVRGESTVFEGFPDPGLLEIF
jgi:hypothetical protein